MTVKTGGLSHLNRLPLAHLAAPAFRLGAVLLIGWLVHAHHLRVTEYGHRPIRLSEVRAFLPEAHNLTVDTRARGGMRVLDASRQTLGYAARTMPHSRTVKGYSGPSDVLLVFDAEEKMLGISIRHSYDTPSHVEDVTSDYLFMEQWNGRTWQELRGEEGVDLPRFHGVSGATRTSEAVVESLQLRTRVGTELSSPKKSLRVRWQDACLALLALAALALAFWKKPWLQRNKTWVHVLMVLYLGLISGDLLAQSLLVGWLEQGIPWRTLPGLCLLAAIAFVVPWSTGHPVYCTHVCPHGHLQRWLMKLVPARRKLRLGQDEKWGLSALPGALLVLVLVVAFLKLPLDLAGIEPFDAWTLGGAGIATLVIAAVSLAVSAFVPMGYCRYGCPTGFALTLVQRDRAGFRGRDLWLLGLLLLALLLHSSYEILKPWLLE